MLLVLLSFMSLLSYTIAIVPDGDDFVDHPNTAGSLSGTSMVLGRKLEGTITLT